MNFLGTHLWYLNLGPTQYVFIAYCHSALEEKVMVTEKNVSREISATNPIRQENAFK